MRRTEMLQEIRKMRFEEAYGGWQQRRLTQEEAARLLGVCERTFRRYMNRYEEDGLEGLMDKRLSRRLHRILTDTTGDDGSPECSADNLRKVAKQNGCVQLDVITAVKEGPIPPKPSS